MPLIKEPRHRVASLVARTWLLSSCGGSEGGSNGAAAARFAYVATPGTVTTYSIDPSSGGLTAVGGPPLTFPVTPFGNITQTATDPSGQTLYVLHYSGVYAYAINPSTGDLTAGAGSPFDSVG